MPIASVGCFEINLAPHENRVDLNLCYDPRINEHKALKEWIGKREGFPTVAHENAYRRIEKFCASWCEKGYFLEPVLGELWTVYDLPSSIDVISPPWLYMSIRKNFLNSELLFQINVALKALSELYGDNYQSLIASARSILEKLPKQVRLSTVGIQDSREKNLLRIYIETKKFEDVIAALEAVAWQGDMQRLRAETEHLAPGCRFYGLAIDFDGQVRNDIGVEFHFQQDGAAQRSNLLNRLVADGLADRAKCEALNDWVGEFSIPTQSDFWSWPNDCLADHTIIPAQTRIRRWSLYVKLNHSSVRPSTYKTYIFFLRSVLDWSP